MAILLSDDFNRANTAVGAIGNPQVGPAPTYPTAGAFISSNQLANNTGPASVAWNLGTPNVEMSANIITISTVTFGQVNLFQGGPEGLLQLTLYTNNVELYLSGGLIWSRVMTTPSTGALMKISYRDKVVRMYRDGELIGRVVLDYALTGTAHGVRMSGPTVKIDNVLAVDAPVVDETPTLSGSVPVQGFSSAAGNPTFLDALSYRGRDTKTLDQAPGA
jgi:hypothetical protein